MKKQHLLFIFYFCLTTLINLKVQAQWLQQNSGTTSHLYGVYFTDENNGVAVGINGIILKTNNGGQLWQNISTSNSNHLVTVFFPSSNIGYAAGFAGTIVKTIDGGNSWTLLNSGTTSYINSLYFFNDSTGFAAGNDSLILFTNDGGITWQLKNNGTNSNQSIYKLSFVSPQIGFASISENPYHGILKTTNGGNNWEKDTIGLNIPFSVFFTDASNGIAVGSFNFIWKTVNGGEDWMAQDSSLGGTYTDVFFPVNGIGYVIGEQGKIVKTMDAGSTWIPEISNSTGSLRSVHFPDLNTGYVVGLDGLILKKGTNTFENEVFNTNTELMVYPNPFITSATIAFENHTNENFTLDIFNIQGVQVNKKENITNNFVHLSGSELSKGMYFFRLKNEVKCYFGKFVVDKKND
ncbi:MAG: YCF48-related protein [Bacteroidales bacterium]|nr:YCF48-related protein [Bacteroidales bacterium]